MTAIKMTMAQAINRALHDAMAADERVLVVCFGRTLKLPERSSHVVDRRRFRRSHFPLDFGSHMAHALQGLRAIEAQR